MRSGVLRPGAEVLGDGHAPRASSGVTLVMARACIRLRISR
jgi:hypothetical protein